jgi:quinohemoprotein ethanol dehydrogenase
VTLRSALVLLVSASALLACDRTSEPVSRDLAEASFERCEGSQAGCGTGAVDDTRLREADADVSNWLTHGRSYDEQRFSPLAQIQTSNVAELGLLWSLDLGTHRGLEATPIVVNGVLYTTSVWSVVHAIDARTGRLLWSFDPRVPRSVGEIACCDAVNRGVALYRGKVFVGTLDGRLVALGAASGEPVWEVGTVDREQPYTITGAPRVVAGKVIIGNGGAEFGVRGYVSAYDAETGALAWRTYTVPGDPSKPFESKALERAAVTWSGEWWKRGGGGTVWDSMAYDPQLGLLYVGTGNGSPWSRGLRSPGGGDNLYLSSILALRPDDGEIVWHYQTTPGDGWDFTATQHMILADLEIGGRLRKTLLQAPKNGFFYVLDRESGELISAQPYVEVTWADGVDLATGRPVVVEGADWREDLTFLNPSPFGGHNWQPMSFSPATGLVYIPAQEIQGAYDRDPEWQPHARSWNTGSDPNLFALLKRSRASGFLLAWDPVQQKEAWRVAYGTPWNGGALATAGGLVFQGTADGRFAAYDARDGNALWQARAGTGVVAAPVTYLVDGKQYVSVMAGWGGSFPLVAGDAAAAAGVRSVGRVLTFALGAKGELPAEPAVPTLDCTRPPPAAAGLAIATDADRGFALFHRWCAHCHGAGAVGGGTIADLRISSELVPESFSAIVLGGRRQADGMPSFADRLSASDLGDIAAYIGQQRETLREASCPEDARESSGSAQN